MKTTDGCIDQLYYNKWTRRQNFLSVDKLFLCLYATFTLGHRLETGERIKLVKNADHQFRRDDELYCIVHDNGYTKEYIAKVAY